MVYDSLVIQSWSVSDDLFPYTKATVEGCLSDTITKIWYFVPRTVYEVVTAPAAYEDALEQTLNKLVYDDLVNAVHGAITRPSTLSHQILTKRDVQPWSSTKTLILDFISDQVAWQGHAAFA